MGPLVPGVMAFAEAAHRFGKDVDLGRLEDAALAGLCRGADEAVRLDRVEADLRQRRDLAAGRERTVTVAPSFALTVSSAGGDDRHRVAHDRCRRRREGDQRAAHEDRAGRLHQVGGGRGGEECRRR